jgi:UDP-2-acetamido-2-deoxy-ribo-hexuluronate aminotransferase
MQITSDDTNNAILVFATPREYAVVEDALRKLDVPPMQVLIEAAITPATKAIMPVSLYGQCADMDAINAIAARHGLTVIEDAAQSFGATYKGRRRCGVSTIGCTSFFPSKPLGCYGDGGAIFTTDGKLAQAMREIRVHGQSKRYQHDRVGVGGRLDTLQAAILLAKLDTFDEEVAARIAIGDRYVALLASVPGVETIRVADDRTSVWGQFTIRVRDRDNLLPRLSEAGIPTAVHYPIPLHRQKAYSQLCRVAGTLEMSEAAAASVMSLPMHPTIDEAVQERIVHTLIGAMLA